jgi:hypothetical protein
MIQHIYHAWCTQHVSVLYTDAGDPYGEILQHCIGLNIPEPLDLLLAGESVVKELDWI